MPMLYSLGQHGALQEVQDSLRPNVYLFAYLDDISVVCPHERVSAIYKFLGQALEENARHMGKTQVWNRGGHMPPRCDSTQVAVQRVDSGPARRCKTCMRGCSSSSAVFQSVDRLWPNRLWPILVI